MRFRSGAEQFMSALVASAKLYTLKALETLCLMGRFPY